MQPVLALEDDLSTVPEALRASAGTACSRLTDGLCRPRRLVHPRNGRPHVLLKNCAIRLVLAFACTAVSGGSSFAGTPEFSALAAIHLRETAVDLDGDGVFDHVRIGAGIGGSTIDIALSQRGSSSLNVRRVTIHRVTGFDIDADGDLDLVASTDAGLAMWKNDGRGSFIRIRESGRSPPSGPFWGASSRASLRTSGGLPRTSDPVVRPVACALRHPKSPSSHLRVSSRLVTPSRFDDGHLRAPPPPIS